MFTAHWRASAKEAAPPYPSRIDNAPKEAIIRMIAKGHDPADAFAVEFSLDLNA